MSGDEKPVPPTAEASVLALEQHIVEGKELANTDDASLSSGSGEDKQVKGGFKDFYRIFTFCDRLDAFLFIVSAVTSIVAGATLPLMTIIFGGYASKFDDFSTGSVSPSAFENDIDHYTLWFIYLFILRFVTTYVANVCVSIAAVRTTRAIRTAVLQSTLRQEIWHFDQENAGSIASQLTTNGNRINQGIADKMAAAIQAVSLFFSAFIVALAVQWKLALITMSIVPVMFLLFAGLVPIDIGYETEITRIYSRASVLAQEAFSSIKTVHAFWAHEKIIKQYDKHLSDAHRVGNKRTPIWATVFGLEYALTLGGSALAFWEGTRLYRSGEIADVGRVLTVVLSVTIGATAVSIVLPQLLAVSGAASAAAELFSIVDKESLLDPLSTSGDSPDKCDGQIEVRNLKFAYPSRSSTTVLHDLSLNIPAGKTTALVGASGCGKSTLIGLLERWYEPSAGNIFLDGRRLAEYNIGWLRSNVRLVQQEPVLFRGTIFDNVTKGLVGAQLDLPREKKMELVQEACKASNAHDFILDLPDGYETQVGERASMLSGGQKQRVAIARSIISDPKILLLDEATSALDPRAEGIVQDALNRVSANKTTLVIAHKLATIKAADNIVVMSHGRIVEQGTHNELVARGGHYALLVRAQDLGGDKGEATFEAVQEDAQLQRHATLEQTQTGGTRTDESSGDIKKLTTGTMGYSLPRCIAIMLLECKSTHPWFYGGVLASLVGGGVYPAEALLFSRLIHVFTLTGDEARNQANFYSLMLFVVALANWLAYSYIGGAANMISQIVTHRYRREMLESIIYMDQDFFDRSENSSGALTSQLTSTPQSIQEMISAQLFLILIVLVNIVASIALAIAYGWKLGLTLAFGGLPLLLGCGWVRVILDMKLYEDTDKRFAESAGLATETVTSIRTVASLTMERDIFRQYGDILDAIVRKSCRSFSINMIGYALSQALEFLIMALGFWYGSRLLASGQYTVTQFYVIYVSIIFGGQASGMFFGYSATIVKAKSACNYVLWLRSLKPTISENNINRDSGPHDDGPLDIENVEFKYKQRDSARVLRGIDMKIEPGSYVACVGPSGCGKSTLIALLERFYDPISGRISFDGQDVKELSPRLYRNHMSLVQQEPTLYQSSVRDNVSLGLQYQPSDDEVYEACRQANALEFVSSLPEGLATLCGTKGLQLSGGQKQRIAIARALIRQPRLLLLDEATSALDTQSERVVQKTLDEAAASRTTIAVAHRLSTIRHADVIFVFANGRIAEVGTHEELQRLKGRYYEMCLAQSLDRA